MVSSAIFLAAIIVPCICVLLLGLWTLILYLKTRSLLQSHSIPSSVPLVTSLQASSPLSPPNFQFAASTGNATLLPIPPRPTRPPSFLEIDPVTTNHTLTFQPGSASTKRFSIATTTSKTGSRVLARNPSSQNSHETSKSGETKRSRGDSPDETRLETARRNRKSFGVGNDETVDVGPTQGEMRRRSSTWTTEDLEQLVDRHEPGEEERHNSKRFFDSVPPERSLSLSILRPAVGDNGTAGDHSSMPPLTTMRQSRAISPRYPNRIPPATSPPLPHELQRPSPSTTRPPHSHLFTRPHVPSSYISDGPKHSCIPASSPSLSANLRTETLPPGPFDRRLSNPSQCLQDLEVVAAGISQPPTPLFSPLALSEVQRLPEATAPFDNRAEPAPREQLPYAAAVTRPRDSSYHRNDVGLARPLSWLQRQGSSGTLPERIMVDANLAVRPSFMNSRRYSYHSTRKST
ncbi:hypothetical protein JCM16303_005444 [Sporobolomyces ruberrimus]